MMHWNLRSHSGDKSSTKWYIVSERKRLEEINKRIKERGRGEKKGDTVVKIKRNRKFLQLCDIVQSGNCWLHYNYVSNAVLLKFVFRK